MCQCPGDDFSWSGSVRTWQSCQQGRRLRERGPKPRCRNYSRLDQCACALGSGEDIMSSSARWSWKRRVFSAIINCFAQEYDTSSTRNDEAGHCEEQEGGCQNSTTCSVEYSSLWSKTDDAEPSVSIWGAGSVLLRERWAPGAREQTGPTDPGLVAPSLIGEKWPEVTRAAPDGLCRRPRRTGGSEPVLLDESCDSSAFAGIKLRLI